MQRSIRRAITVGKDTRQDVISAKKELLQQIIRCNNVNINDVLNIVFIVTTDIKSEFTTVVSRELGLVDVSLIDCQQMMHDGVLEYCIRVVLTYNTEKNLNRDIKHIYLRVAEVLRPDLLKKIEG